MSTSQFEWLVQVPDKPNALAKRLAVRPKHLEDIKPRVAAGQVVFGGATLSDQPSVDGTPDMTGSVMLIKADTKEEIIQLLRNDQYYKGGAWDVDKAIITPFRCAIRTAMD